MRDLFSARFVIVAGKGGVGRTTVAAALATLAARRGKRTLLAQVNAKDRLTVLLGGTPVGDTVTTVQPNLDAVNMNPAAALRQYGLMILRYEAIYKAVLENRMVKGFLRAIPGLDDYSMLGKAYWHATEERDGAGRHKYDLVIFDAPATGHAVTMLRLPQAILETVPEGPLTQTARRVSELMHDAARTAMVIVTLAEDLPVSEARDFYRANEELLKLPLSAIVVNQLWPRVFDEVSGPGAVFRQLEKTGCGVGDPMLGPLCERARTAHERRRLNDRYLERLAIEVPVPQLHLPYLFRPQFGAAELTDLAGVLDEQLAALQAEDAALAGE
ncbi:MAG TPA: ArsA-related P-loop ATPase [Polyangia bacterium]|jgi:anion-transporting  ArsA/GET3 family ATPase